MKSNVTRETQSFKPIKFSLEIETVEELKQFLLLTSVLENPIGIKDDAFADAEISLSSDHSEYEQIDLYELTHFVGKMISLSDWENLRRIYNAEKLK